MMKINTDDDDDELTLEETDVERKHEKCVPGAQNQS